MYYTWSSSNNFYQAVPILQKCTWRVGITKLTVWNRALPWEAASCAASQEFSNILWILKVHCSVHQSLSFGSIQATKLHLVLLIDFSILEFPSKFCMYSSFFHSCYMPCQSHPPWLGNLDYSWWKVQVMKVLSMQFSPTFCHVILL
jgi:hypothetical protein